MPPVSSQWPSHGIQCIASAAYLVVTCTMTVLLRDRFPSFIVQQWRGISWARICAFACLLNSWLFLVSSDILLFGVDTTYSDLACAFGIWWCIWFYAGSKLCIYLFLVERSHIVNGGGQSRWKSTTYRAATVIMLGWLAAFILMILGRLNQLENGVCHIGLGDIATIPLIVVDICANLYLSLSFILPLVRGRWVNRQMQWLALRSLVSAAVALLTSLANIILMAALKGRQLSIVCLGSCGLDVFVNAVILYYITSYHANEAASTEEYKNSSSRRRTDLKRATSGVIVTSHSIATLDVGPPEKPPPTLTVAGESHPLDTRSVPTAVLAFNSPGSRTTKTSTRTDFSTRAGEEEEGLSVKEGNDDLVLE